MNNKKHDTKPTRDLRELNLLDRFLFDEAVERPGFLEAVLSIILEEDIAFKYPPQTEKEQRRSPENRRVTLDVWAEDVQDRIYDTEVQQKNTGNLPRRFRLYHALIASKQLPAGTKNFNDLNDAVVIVIAPFDLFGEGRYRYTFEMRCRENPALSLEDGMTTIFLNTHGKNRDEVSDELIELLRYFEHSTAATASGSASDTIRALHDQVEAVRASEEVRIKYMNRWEEDMELIEKGFEQGIEQNTKRIILRMHQNGKGNDEIAQDTDTSIDEVERILRAHEDQPES